MGSSHWDRQAEAHSLAEAGVGHEKTFSARALRDKI